MKKDFYLLLLFMIFLVLTQNFIYAKTKSNALPRVVLGYYPSWDTGVSPAQINYKLFTHIAHAFIVGDIKGNLKMDGNMPSTDLTTRAHAAGVKVLISIGGEDSGKNFFNDMTKDSKATEKFADGVINVLVKYHYDGVDVDWEFPATEQDKKDLTALVAQFREKLSKKAPGSLMSMAVPSSDWNGKWFEEALFPFMDFVNVMTYDFHGPWGTNGHNAALYPVAADKTDDSDSVVHAMDYWSQTRKCPVQKLMVGMPCFGHGFVGKWYETPKEKTKYPDFHYKDAEGLIQQGWQKHWDSEAGVPYLVSKDGKETISYDDEKSIGLKAQWAKKHDFHGIFFWEITEDFITGENPLVKAGRKAYLGK